MSETKNIQGYEGLYTISNVGVVTSLARNNGTGTRKKDKILLHDKTELPSGVYSRVSLCSDGVVKRYSVHRLVAQAFIPNPDNKPFVNHIDNNPQNNAVTNLEWCTHEENMVHAQKQGRLYSSQSKGGTEAGIKAAARFDAKAREYLGSLFNYSKPSITKSGKRGKRKVVYSCRVCGGESIDAIASKAIKVHMGVCLACQIRNKI